MQRSTGLLLAAVTAAVLASPAQARPDALRMPLGGATTPPLGYVEFCATRPGECRERAKLGEAGAPGLSSFWREAFNDDRTSAFDTLSDRPGRSETQVHSNAATVAPGGRISLTSANLALLNSVNRQVNQAIVPAADRAQGRASDIWSLPIEDGVRAGDCEDYVLEKRRALAAQGLPLAALSIAVVRTRAGETHAVLVVDTDAGDLVLDNRSNWLAPWHEVGYRWIKRQDPSDPAKWVRVGGL